MTEALIHNTIESMLAQFRDRLMTNASRMAEDIETRFQDAGDHKKSTATITCQATVAPATDGVQVHVDTWWGTRFKDGTKPQQVSATPGLFDEKKNTEQAEAAEAADGGGE